MVIYNHVRSHADTRHPEEAPVVRKCINEKIGDQYKLEVSKSKQIRICNMPDGRWGFQVLLQIGSSAAGKDYAEITAYVRESIRTVGDLVNYTVQRGGTLYRLEGNEWILVK